jgi:hypothetical protein
MRSGGCTEAAVLAGSLGAQPGHIGAPFIGTPKNHEAICPAIG